MDEIPSRLRDVLESTGQRLGLRSAVETGLLWSSWRDIVGPAVADHAEPTSLRGGVLRIRTDSPAWATEIGYLAGEIKRRANEAVGATLVRDVRVWTGPRETGAPGSGRRLPERDRATTRRRARATDPTAAMEAARRAWARRVGRERGPDGPA